IVEHLTRILQAEAVPFEPGALRHLAKAASGSMRDALSLLDQAIAHGAGKVEEEQVTHMLGTVGDDHLYAVLDALAAGDVAGLLAVADGMEARSLSFDAALQALATLLHRIALAQYAPEAIGDEAERARILAYVDRFDAEFLQLAYQIAIHGRDELALAPDEYTGFTMTLRRLLGFRPEQPAALGGPGVQPGPAGRARAVGGEQDAFAGKPAPTGRAAPTGPASATGQAAAEASAPPTVSAPPAASPPPAAEASIPATPAPGSAAASVGASSPATAPPPRASDQSPTASVGAGLPANAAPVAAPPEHDVPPWEDLPAEAYAEDDGRPARAERVSMADEDLAPRPRAVPAPRPSARTDAPAARRANAQGAAAAVPSDAAVAAASAPATPAPPRASGPSGDAAALLALGDWRGLIRALGLGGLVRELAQHCEWVECGEDGLQLRLSTAHRHLLDMNRAAVDRLQDLLTAALGRPLKLRIEIGDIAGETPAQRDEQERRARHAEAVAALEADPFVRELIERFDATLVESTVKPL
ncbi:MAG: DNA polymerase III subunit gamma/tau, partial [Thauera sp.]|nr:DNA polymerase III subunit gamma/tau [Thauera sp.]